MFILSSFTVPFLELKHITTIRFIPEDLLLYYEGIRANHERQNSTSEKTTFVRLTVIGFVHKFVVMILPCVVQNSISALK